MRNIIIATMLGATIVVMSAGAGFAANLMARIDVSSQTMTVSEYGRVLYRWPVSTARRGYHTPRGRYRPTRMYRMWRSHKYHNSPMPHSVFFRGGYAIHGTYSVRALGRPASHGCIRLRPSHAATFYALVKDVGARNTRIVVVD